MQLKVVITDYEYPSIDTEREVITGAGHELVAHQANTEDALIAATCDADAVIVQYASITRAVIERLKHCRMIIKYGIGVNNIDVDAATEHRVYVCNVPDYGLDEVSNHAIAMLLSCARKLSAADRGMKNGVWGNSCIRPVTRLAGCTLGLVGFGALGQLVAKKMRGFDLRIIAFDPYLDQKRADELGVRGVDFETLCRESDFISVHCPLNKHTQHLFNKSAFQQMKQTAYFINTSRGGVVCENDLIEALAAGKIAGAGLDVYEVEPLSRKSKLLEFPNVITTGHLAWYSDQAISTLQLKVAEEVVNVLAGNKPFHPCNKF